MNPPLKAIQKQHKALLDSLSGQSEEYAEVTIGDAIGMVDVLEALLEGDMVFALDMYYETPWLSGHQFDFQIVNYLSWAQDQINRGQINEEKQ